MTRQPRPVFVDPTGRRRRIVVPLTVGLAVCFLAVLGLLVLVVATGGAVPVPGWSDQSAQSDAGRDSAVIGPAPARTPPGRPAPNDTTGQPAGDGPGTAAVAAAGEPDQRPPAEPASPASALLADRIGPPGRGDEHGRPTASPSAREQIR